MKACPLKHITVSTPGAKFCWECGAELVDMPNKVCACGNFLTKRQKFCEKCGRKTDVAA
jgi:hypothetical protein